MFLRNCLAICMLMVSSLAMAGYNGNNARYEVTITNITPGQTFTPQLVMTHRGTLNVFTLGEPASNELALLAEGGDTGPLTALLSGEVSDIETIPGLLGPGQSATVTVVGHPRKGYISMAAMLIPTNDTFVAMNNIRLPRHGKAHHFLSAYDAGTEYNDQNCLNIPGPRCGGQGPSIEATELDEGFVHIGNGFHALGDYDQAGNEILSPQVYDWRNSVAKVVVKRVR